MANSGPGWEGIDMAWWDLQVDRENERYRQEREAREAERETAPPPP